MPDIRTPSIIRAEIAELKQKIERAQQFLVDIDNRAASYTLDTDPKHANTVANKVRAAEQEKKDTANRIDSYNNKIKALEEEIRVYFRNKAENEIADSLKTDEEEKPPKAITISYSDIVSFLLAKNASISFESVSTKVNRLKRLLPDLTDNQIKIFDVNQRTSGGYPMKFGISGHIYVSDLNGLPAGYYNYFRDNKITELEKVVAIVRSDFDALSPLIVTHDDDENPFNLNFESFNVYGESLREAKEETCCICGEPINGYGNNPEPYRRTGRCCDACNIKFVIPARLEQAASEEE